MDQAGDDGSEPGRARIDRQQYHLVVVGENFINHKSSSHSAGFLRLPAWAPPDFSLLAFSPPRLLLSSSPSHRRLFCLHRLLLSL